MMLKVKGGNMKKLNEYHLIFSDDTPIIEILLKNIFENTLN